MLLKEQRQTREKLCLRGIYKMFSIDELLGMIATEAVEGLDKKYIKQEGYMPGMRYDLRLIREPNGMIRWEE